MSKPKKNQQKGKNVVRLQDALLQFKLKNYTGALKRLRSADLKSGEEQKAKNLEYAVIMHLALTDMNELNYQSALKYLLPLTPTDVRAAAFAGISYLYLLDYKSAIPLLKKAVETYPSFGFYHILAELYLQKDVDFEAFTEYYKKEWAYCTDSQKQYIQLIAYCFENDQEAVAQTAALMKSQSHFQHLNFDLFKNLLTQTPLSIEASSDKLKPLYRLMAQGNLTNGEKTYFQQLENSVPALSPLLKRQSNITPHLQKEIEAQYHHKKLLDEDTLAAVMKAASAEQRPYIAYNQAANAQEQEYFEDADRGIKHVIIKYGDDFVQIPESLPIYLEIHKDPNTKTYPSTFWQFVSQWLSIRKGNISVDNLDDMGWVIFDIIFRHGNLIDSAYRKELLKLIHEYPSVFAFKFAEISFPYKSVAGNQAKAACLDLLSLPNAEKSKSKFIEHIDFLLTSLSYDSPLNNLFERMPKEIFIKQVVDYATFFMAAVTDYKTPPQNSIALEGFMRIHKYIRQIIGHNDKLPQGFYDNFLKTYSNLVAGFEKHPDIQAYKRDIQTFENDKYIRELRALTDYVSHTSEFLLFLKKYPEITDYGFVWDDFERLIDKTHFEYSIAGCLVNFIEALYIHQKDEKKTFTEIAYFLQVYGRIFENYSCEHPATFLGVMIKYIVKKGNLSPKFIYEFSINYIEKLTLNNLLDPKHYNAVIDFLDFMLSRGSVMFAVSDKVLMNKLKDYLKVVNTSKRLKKIDALLIKLVTIT